jgi:deoxyribodipyrimidine photo-lyase
VGRVTHVAGRYRADVKHEVHATARSENSVGVGRADATVVWFKRDLRVADHRPLMAAVRNGGPVIPLYVVEPSMLKLRDFHPAHYSFVRDCLVELREDLAALGAPLVVRVGEAVDVLDSLRIEYRVTSVLAHEETGNGATFARDRAVLAWAKLNRVDVGEAPTNGVVRRLPDRDQWSAIHRSRMATPIEDTPERIVAVVGIDPGSIPTGAELGLAPVGRDVQRGGRSEVSNVWRSFAGERHRGYQYKLSSPVTAWDACSRLSPHLAYGTVSMRMIMKRLQRIQGGLGKGDTSKKSFSAFGERLYWHDHFIQKLEDEPRIEFESFVPDFDQIRQTDDEAKAAAWREGRTGYPLVDACMRALEETGWLNFRMRAMVVSFASYDLWQPWRSTGLHLARCFTDYEPGIHWSQIQMQSGTSGINALRVYDPTKQAVEQDPEGTFIRQWIPELRDVPTALIHQPQLSGADYPPQIVDHASAARRATAEVQRIRRRAQLEGRLDTVLERHGSRRPSPSKRRAAAKQRRR